MLQIINGSFLIKNINKKLIIVFIIMNFTGCNFNKSLPNKFRIFDNSIIGKWEVIDNENKKNENIEIEYNKKEYEFKSNYFSKESIKIKANIYKLNGIKILQLDFGNIISKANRFIKGKYSFLKIVKNSPKKIILIYLNFSKLENIIDEYYKDKLEKYDYSEISGELLYKLIDENKNLLFSNTKKIILIKK